MVCQMVEEMGWSMVVMLGTTWVCWMGGLKERSSAAQTAPEEAVWKVVVKVASKAVAVVAWLVACLAAWMDFFEAAWRAVERELW